jgi:hypothetical protein
MRENAHSVQVIGADGSRLLSFVDHVAIDYRHFCAECVQIFRRNLARIAVEDD